MSLNDRPSCKCTFHPEVRHQQPCIRFTELYLLESIGVRRILEFLMYCCEQLPGIFLPVFLLCSSKYPMLFLPDSYCTFPSRTSFHLFRKFSISYFSFVLAAKCNSFFRSLENSKWMYICVSEIVFKFRERWCQRHFFGGYFLLFPTGLIFYLCHIYVPIIASRCCYLVRRRPVYTNSCNESSDRSVGSAANY
jgi:hypothetical protein